MKISNRSNLPEALVRAIENDSYDAGDSDFTATSLLKPSRMWALQRKHKDDIVEDAEDSLYRLYGQVAHGILERANMNDLAEKRFFTEILGKKVSAQLDTLSLVGGVLSDYKFTTSYAFKSDQPPKIDFVCQLNIQLELLRRNGLDASKLQIVGLLRDWQIREAKANPAYPQNSVAIMPITMWSREQTVSFIEMRIASHLAAELELPTCSPEERRGKPDIWAVMKGKKAIPGGIQYSQGAAVDLLMKNPGTTIQFRRGESIRCKSYCSAAPYCSQFKGDANEV